MNQQPRSWDGRFLRHSVHYAIANQSNRKINTSTSTVEEKEHLKKFLTTPPVKKIDLHFPLGLEVTARNLKGVTIKDALDAIYKQYKKRVSRHPSLSAFSDLGQTH